jgi:Trypsin-like peptidase domain
MKRAVRKLPNPDCVVQVGYGRGFVVGSDSRRLVLTAAHCLPKLPPPHALSYLEERTYGNLLAPLSGKRTVWAECLFADPVADIAVLGAPDNQELFEEAEAFEDLVSSRRSLRIGNAQDGEGWMLSLDNRWVPTRIAVCGTWNASLEIGPTQGGQSGSPILGCSGQAVGIIVVGSETLSINTGQTTNERSAGNPILACALPGWLLRLARSGPRKQPQGGLG